MIVYLKGDVTRPIECVGRRFLCHVCNDVGRWGAGFVLALSKRWTKPEEEYKGLTEYSLGDIQSIQVESGLNVINMIAQHGLRSQWNPMPVDYNALETCLNRCAKLARMYSNEQVTFHMPRIGCGLGGGNWDDVKEIIERKLPEFPIFIYDLE